MDAKVVARNPAEISWRANVLDYPTAPRDTEAVEILISSVEALFRGLPAAADSETSRLRAQATNALAAAKAAVASNRARVADDTDPLATAYLDVCVREWPKTTLAVAAALGLVIGLWAGRSAS